MQHLFLRTGGSHRRVLEAKVRLARYSQHELHALVAEIGFKGFTMACCISTAKPERSTRPGSARR